MKKSFLFWALLLVLGSTSSFAQHQKEKESFLAEFEWNFIGDYTYNYILQENGMRVKDGPFDMKATVDSQSTIAGEYTLTGNHSYGDLHGPLTMSANLKHRDENNTYTFKGNFKNGLPDGNFKVEYPSYGINVNVNYKDGYLVGQYYVRGKDRLPYEISGTLTSDSKPTGLWKFDYSTNSYEMNFSNGVVVNRADYDPDLRNKAKAYASGSITREELLEEHIYVKEDSLELGKDAWNHILHEGVCFEKFGYYSFAQSEHVKYCYLDRLPFFSEEGFLALQYCLVTSDGFRDASFSTGQCEKDLYQEFYGGVIRYDEDVNLYYCTLHNSSTLCNYCVGYPDWSKYYENIYLTNEQVVELRVFLHAQRMLLIDKKDIASLTNKDIESFEQSPYDENVLVYTYNFNSFPGLIYFSRDTFENYFISKGQLSDLIKVTPSARHEIVNEKYQKHIDTNVANVENWLNNIVVNVAYERLGSEFMLADRSCFPIISYKTDNVMASGGNSFVLYSTVDVGEDTGKFRTYEVDVYVNINEKGMPEVDIRNTFNKSNYKRIRNDYDVIDEMDALINEKNTQIKVLSTNKFKPYYSSYASYYNGLNLSLNHDNIQTSIDERKAVLSVLNNVFVFVDKLDRIYEGDNEVTAKCSDIKDVNKAYSSYLKTRDFVWRPDFTPEELDVYFEIQDNCVEFARLRRLVTEYDVKIKEQKSVAPKIFKAYSAYRSDFDLDWNSEDDLTEIQTLLETQNRYLNVFIEKLKELYEGDSQVAVECADIKDINKAYSAYVKDREIFWLPDFDVEMFDEHFKIQKNCVEFAKLRRQVTENDVKIKEQKEVAPKVYKTYTAYRSDFDLSWNPKVDFAVIRTLLDTQDRYLNVYIEYLKDVYEGDDEVALKKADAKDVVKAYSAYVKARELSWEPDFDAGMFDKHFEIQRNCLEFISLRVIVQNNDEIIKGKKSVASHIYKAYDAYKDNCDLTWNENIDFTQINALIDVQERCLNLMEKEDIKQINKRLKKQKVTDIIEILDEN